MGVTLRHHGGWAGVAILLVGVVASWLLAADAEAIEVRVRAQSDLEVDARAAGTDVRVSGTLRDENGRGLAQRRIRVTYQGEPADGGDAYREDTTHTDRNGRFTANRELEPGEWKVAVYFEETDHVTESRVDRTLQVEPEPVDLVVSAPEVVFSRSEGVPVSVRATVGDVGLSAPASVTVGDSVAEQVELDQFGRATVDVSGTLEPGDNTIEVDIPAGDYRERASASRTVRLVDDLEATARFDEVIERMQRGVAVRGRLVDANGPLESVRIQTRVRRVDDGAGGGGDSDGGRGADEGEDAAEGPRSRPDISDDEERARFERRIRTDSDGRFEAFYGGDVVGDGTWRAETAVVPEVGEQMSLETEPLEVARGRWNWLFNGLAILGVAGALGLVIQRLWQVIGAYLKRRRETIVFEERAARSLQETDTIKPEALGDAHQPIDHNPQRTRISAILWDAWRDNAVERATVKVRSEDGTQSREVTVGAGDWPPGGFVIDDLGRGRYTLRVEAPGFMPAELEARLPHDGSLSNARLNLTAVPLKIRWLYQSVVERLQGEDLWGRLSPRQIEEAIVDAADRGERRGESARGAFIDSLRRRLDEADGPLTVERLAGVMTDLVEETYFSGRQFDEEVWRFARDVAQRLESLAGAGEEAT